jgi:hypothetical protein
MRVLISLTNDTNASSVMFMCADSGGYIFCFPRVPKLF